MKLRHLLGLLAVVAFAIPAHADVMYWQVNVASGQAEFSYGRLMALNTSNQSITEVAAGIDFAAYDNTTIKPTITDVTTFSSATYSFYVELGNYSGNNWIATAETASINYDSLVSSGAISAASFSGTPTYHTYTTITAVPEPGSLGLLLLGVSFMMLRRRNLRTI